MRTNRYISKYCNLEINGLVYVILLFFIVSLHGCASSPKNIETIRFKEVVIPVACKVEIPEKPTYIPENLSSARDLAEYYEIVELLLKECVGVGQSKNLK